MLSEDNDVKPTISLKKIDTSSNFSGTMVFPLRRSRATGLRIKVVESLLKETFLKVLEL